MRRRLAYQCGLSVAVLPFVQTWTLLRRRITTSIGMHAIDLAPYCIHATDPANAAQVEYECLGFT